MTRNTPARIAFGLWLLAVGVFVFAVVAGVIVGGTGDDPASGFAVLTFPVIASFAYTPLLLIGIIAAVAALRQVDRPKRLAIAALVLNILGFLIATVVFMTALSLYFGV